jgi:hypothetical protein
MARSRDRLIALDALHADGSRWRLNRLDEQRRAKLARRTFDTRPPTGTGLNLVDLNPINALRTGCRQSAVQLADHPGLSPRAYGVGWPIWT